MPPAILKCVPFISSLYHAGGKGILCYILWMHTQGTTIKCINAKHFRNSYNNDILYKQLQKLKPVGMIKEKKKSAFISIVYESHIGYMK